MEIRGRFPVLDGAGVIDRADSPKLMLRVGETFDFGPAVSNYPLPQELTV